MPEPDFLILDHPAIEAAGLFISGLDAAIKLRGVASFVLAGGSTPLDLYKWLASSLYGDLEWGKVHIFWGDERLVPPDDPGSNYAAARDTLLDHVAIQSENIHRIRGELPADEAVADYTERLREWALAHDPGAPNAWPRFDLLLLGLGEDGHTASLFPGSPVEATAPVIAVAADYQGRPAGRVTLTPPVLNDSRYTIFLVSGRNKADAVFNTFYTDDPFRYPAQRIHTSTDPGPLWVLDKGAASHLDWRGHRPPG